MSDTPDTPDTPDSPLPETETASAEPSSQVAESASLSPWLWLVAGLVAAIIVPIAVHGALSRPPVASEELIELGGKHGADMTEEETARLAELEAALAIEHQQQLSTAAGAAVAVVFGLFAGIIHRRIAMGVLGALVGAGVAFGLAQLTARPILDLQEQAIGKGGDTYGMVMHSVQWIAIGVAGAVAVLIGSTRVLVGVKALGALLLSGILGGVIYVVLGTLIDPASQTLKAVPVEGTPRYLWTSLPPLVASLMLARSKK